MSASFIPFNEYIVFLIVIDLGYSSRSHIAELIATPHALSSQPRKLFGPRGFGCFTVTIYYVEREQCRGVTGLDFRDVLYARTNVKTSLSVQIRAATLGQYEISHLLRIDDLNAVNFGLHIYWKYA